MGTPYPRNPIGVGYPLQPREAPALEGRCLPNFEDPSDPLTVERLLAIDPARWLDAPLPAGTTCLMPFTFPRAALLYDVDPEDALRVVAEERPDLRAEDFAERGRPLRADPSAASSASSGLRCLPLRGDEPLVLEHLHPDSRLVASRLPDARVTVTFRLTATRWEMAPAELRKVVLAPDERRMTLTYAATIPVAEEVISAGIDDVRVDVEWA